MSSNNSRINRYDIIFLTSAVQVMAKIKVIHYIFSHA